MKSIPKLILGTLGAFVLLALAVSFLGLVVVYAPIPNSWWGNYSAAVGYGIDIVSFAPFAIAGAFASRKIFKKNAIFWSFVCFFGAFAVDFGSLVFESTASLWPYLRPSLELILVFVAGVPFIVYILERLHANSQPVRTPESTRRIC